MQFPFSINAFQFEQQTIYLAVPDVEAVQESYRRGDISFPYWSKVWPAAIALANFITSHFHYIQNKKVLELAAGLALPSLAAAKYAASVRCTDHEAATLEFINASLKKNSITNVNIDVLDWKHLPANIEAEVLLLSDVNYEPSNFASLQALLQGFLQQSTTIILSTPQRLMSKPFIESLLPFCVHQEEAQVQDNAAPVAISLLVLKAINQAQP